MHQWVSPPKLQVGVLALTSSLEVKHNFYLQIQEFFLWVSYSWPLEYFQAYDQKWHQTLESALLTSLYANFCWRQCLHFLRRCKCKWRSKVERGSSCLGNLCCFKLFAKKKIRWNTAAIRTAKLLSVKNSHEHYTFFEKFSFFSLIT